MVSLLSLVEPYPVAEALASQVGLGDLIRLSRVNSCFRAVLHGFSNLVDRESIGQSSAKEGSSDIRLSSSRDLFLGQHQTPFWRNLKFKSQLLCSEPQHKRGPAQRGCISCSMPVCEGCIVRASWGKQENTFQNRRRHLCSDCWSSGVPHRDSHLKPHTNQPISYDMLDVCICSVKHGWLCLKCKIEQKTDVEKKMERCWGSQCTNSSGFEKERRLICLWCDHPLVPKARLNESRRDYDSRHLFSNGSGLDVEGKIQTGPPRFGESPGSPGTVTRVQDDGAFTRNGRQRPSPTQQHLGHPFSSVQDGVELLNDMSEDPDSLKSNPSSSSTDSYEPVSSTGERPPAYSAVRMGE